VKIELAGSQLLVAAPEASSRIELSAIRRIGESDTHYFIYIGPVAAIVVPKARAGSQEFVSSLRTAMAAA
jgi:hypothetical protein